jgi:hypothetical protein
VQFVAILAGVALFLWHADLLALARGATWLAVLTAALWAVGALMQGRITVIEVLLVEAAALATATAADGWPEWHRVFKPLAMLLAIAWVAARRGQGRSRLLLLAALALCLAGDVFLMFEGFFIPAW